MSKRQVPVRRARTYVKKELAPRLGLRRWSVLPATTGNTNLVADGDGRRFYLKILHSDRRALAARAPAVHRVMVEAGANVPRLVHSDDGSGAASRYDLACIVTEEIRGRPLSIDDVGDRRSCFRTLGWLHGVTAEAALTPLRAHEAVRPDWSEPEVGAFKVRQAMARIRKSGLEPDPACVDAVGRIVTERASPLWKSKLTQGLVHGDYKLSNLLIEDDGRVAMLDFYGARPGALILDLASALIKCQPMLTETGARSVLPLPRPDLLEGDLAAYGSAAPPSLTDEWQEHAEASLAIAYLHRLSRRVRTRLLQHARGGDPIVRRGLEEGWRQLRNFLDA